MIAAIGNSEYLRRRTAPLLRTFNGPYGLQLLVGTDHPKDIEGETLVPVTREQVFERPDVETVYVSSATGRHYQDCVDALSHGKHVLVEKPICLTTTQLNDLENRATRAKRMVQECLTYHYSPRWRDLLSSFQEAKQTDGDPAINIAFTIPHRSNADFRYDIEHGGATADLGTYVVDALLRLGFSRRRLLGSAINTGQKNHGFNAILRNGASIEVEWGIGCDYQNHIEVNCGAYRRLLGRAFSPPTDQKTRLIVDDRKKRVRQTTWYGPVNTTANFLRWALRRVHDDTYGVHGYWELYDRLEILEELQSPKGASR